jgi:hypothetical protein
LAGVADNRIPAEQLGIAGNGSAKVALPAATHYEAGRYALRRLLRMPDPDARPAQAAELLNKARRDLAIASLRGDADARGAAGLLALQPILAMMQRHGQRAAARPGGGPSPELVVWRRLLEWVVGQTAPDEAALAALFTPAPVTAVRERREAVDELGAWLEAAATSDGFNDTEAKYAYGRLRLAQAEAAVLARHRSRQQQGREANHGNLNGAVPIHITAGDPLSLVRPHSLLRSTHTCASPPVRSRG